MRLCSTFVLKSFDFAARTARMFFAHCFLNTRDHEQVKFAAAFGRRTLRNASGKPIETRAVCPAAGVLVRRVFLGFCFFSLCSVGSGVRTAWSGVRSGLPVRLPDREWRRRRRGHCAIVGPCGQRAPGPSWLHLKLVAGCSGRISCCNHSSPRNSNNSAS